MDEGGIYREIGNGNFYEGGIYYCLADFDEGKVNHLFKILR